MIGGFVSWCSGIVTALRNPAEDFAKLHLEIDRILQDYIFAASVQNALPSSAPKMDRATIGGGIKFTSEKSRKDFYRETETAVGNDLQAVVKVLEKQNYQFQKLRELTANLSTQIEKLRKE